MVAVTPRREEDNMKKFIVVEEGGETEVEASDAAQAASEYVEDQYHGSTRTIFVDVRVFAIGDRITRKNGKSFSFVLQPDEPKCSRKGEHQWEDGPIFASGPSVAYTDTCSRCGLRRRTDNNGQNPEDGTQGHRTLEYLDAK